MPHQHHTSPLPISPLPPHPRNNPSPYHHSSPYLTSQRHQVLALARQLISPFARKVKICRRRRKDGGGVVKYNARVVGKVGEKRGGNGVSGENRENRVNGEDEEGGDGKDEGDEGDWEAVGEEVVLVGKKDVWFQSEEEAVRWLRGEVGRVWAEEGRGRGYVEDGREGGWGDDAEEREEREEEEDGGWI